MERVSYCLKRDSFFYHSRQHLEEKKEEKRTTIVYTLKHVDIQTLLYILVGGS